MHVDLAGLTRFLRAPSTAHVFCVPCETRCLPDAFAYYLLRLTPCDGFVSRVRYLSWRRHAIAKQSATAGRSPPIVHQLNNVLLKLSLTCQTYA